MVKTGVANLPLHTGKCPRWLFGRMEKLGGVVSEIIIDEYGQNEYLRRLSDPYFFQAFGCVLGFDWHSSGLTVTTTGALKESVNKLNLRIKIAGGKGKTSRKAPEQIEKLGDELSISTKKIEKLKYSSKMSAKVDSVVLQDNYQLYHHCFVFTEKGKYTVIQQGMNSESRYARRYHWLSDNVEELIEEPHEGICCDKKEQKVLDMTNKKSKETRKTSLDIVKDNPNHLKKFMRKPFQKTIHDFTDKKAEEFTMMPRHTIIGMNKRNFETLKRAYEVQPRTYEELVAIKGVGVKTIRSLALISELVYGSKSSWKDPVKYSFAHGGKDGVPYPLNRKLMDGNTRLLMNAIRNAKLGNREEMGAIKRLNSFY